jgi:hypothetical protein
MSRGASPRAVDGLDLTEGGDVEASQYHGEHVREQRVGRHPEDVSAVFAMFWSRVVLVSGGFSRLLGWRFFAPG